MSCAASCQMRIQKTILMIRQRLYKVEILLGQRSAHRLRIQFIERFQIPFQSRLHLFSRDAGDIAAGDSLSGNGFLFHDTGSNHQRGSPVGIPVDLIRRRFVILQKCPDLIRVLFQKAAADHRHAGHQTAAISLLSLIPDFCKIHGHAQVLILQTGRRGKGLRQKADGRGIALQNRRHFRCLGLIFQRHAGHFICIQKISNTSSAPNTTSHSSNVKTEVKSSSTSKKEKKITAKAVDESSVVAESSSVDSNNNNSVSTNSNVQTATNQVASANSSVAKESSSVATGNNNVTGNAVAPSVAAESSQKVQEVNQQLSPAQIAALAAYYMGNDANSLTVHNMGNYNAVSGADGQLLFAYSADGNNLKVGGFGDTPWDSVNANDVMQKAQQQGNKDSINQVANNTTFEKGY